ncbi:MAG: ATP-binding protein [Lachnospiraceae bacterium]|nr:ATP-binding protein [Lachnospiraceae bacterium]
MEKKTINDIYEVLDLLPVGTIRVVIESGELLKVKYVSKSLCTMLGYEMEELLALMSVHLTDIAHDKDAKAFNNLLYKATYGKKTNNLRLKLKKKDGNYLPVGLQCSETTFEEGKHCFYISVTDRTEISNAQEALKAEKSKEESVRMDTHSSIWYYDIVNERFTFEKKWAEDVHAEKLDALQSWQKVLESGVILDDSRAMYMDLHTDLADFIGAQTTARVIHFKNEIGRELWLRITYTTIVEGDKVVAAKGISTDLSEIYILERNYEKEIQNIDTFYGDSVILKGRYSLQDERCFFLYTAADTGFEVSENKKAITQDGNYSSHYEYILSEVTNAADRERMASLIKIDKLRKSYEEGQKRIRISYERQFPNGRRFVDLFIRLSKNPRTREVEAFCYLMDVHSKTLFNDAINEVYESNFSFLGVLDYTLQKVYFYKPLNDTNKSLSEIPDIFGFDEMFEYLVRPWVSKDNDKSVKQKEETAAIEIARRSLNPDNIYKSVVENGGAFAVAINSEDDKVRTEWGFKLIDEENKRVVFAQHDSSSQYASEIEQRKKLQEALDEAKTANAAKSNFISSVSHDIRTPLNVVVNLREIISIDIERGDFNKCNEDLEIMKGACDYLDQLVNDVLDIQRIETGRIFLKPAPYSIHDFVTNLYLLFENECKKKDLSFSIDYDRENSPIMIIADAVRLNQIFVNLISNAIKYTDCGGFVSLKIETLFYDGKRVKYRGTVSDNGTGMSEEFQKRMFGAFEREEINANKVGGIGLGLSIVKSLVEKMNGTISVKSELFKGTQFSVEIEFDVVEKVPERVSYDELTEKDYEILKGKRVLIVDDHEINLKILERFVLEKSMQCECARNGLEALRKVIGSDDGYFDAIIMDIRMPELDGDEAAKRIRMLTRKDVRTIPIIALSGDGDFEEKALAAGMNECIFKPIAMPKVIETLYYLIKNRREF